MNQNNQSDRGQEKERKKRLNFRKKIKFYTRLGDPTRIILKKRWFSDLEILEICRQLMKKMLTQNSPKELKDKILKTTAEPGTTMTMLLQEKHCTSDQMKHFYHEGIKTGRKGNKLIKRIQTNNVTKLNDLIYAGTMVVKDKRWMGNDTERTNKETMRTYKSTLHKGKHTKRQ